MLFTLLSFIISAAIIPIVIRLCSKYGWYDTVNQRKVHSGNIPRLGGIGFVIAFIIVSSLYTLSNSASQPRKMYLVIIAGLFIFIFGIIDDFRDLPAKIKLLVQTAAAAVTIGAGYTFTQIGPLQLGSFQYIITFIWIIGVINAFNLIDGVDALCGGLAFFIMTTIGIIFLLSGVKYAAELCFILSASIAGFLLYNKPKAKIFMGDGGSQFLGFMAAVFPLYPVPVSSFYYNRFAVVFVLASIPILDTFAAIIRRTRERRSFFTPDRAHLHHKLMNLGYTTKNILILLYSIQAGICAAVLVAIWTGGRKSLFILSGCLLAIIGFFCIIHYTNRAVQRTYRTGLNGCGGGQDIPDDKAAE